MHVRQDVMRQFQVMIPEDDHQLVINFLQKELAALGQNDAGVRHLAGLTYQVAEVAMTDHEVEAVIDAIRERFDDHYWEPPFSTPARLGLVPEDALSA